MCDLQFIVNHLVLFGRRRYYQCCRDQYCCVAEKAWARPWPNDHFFFCNTAKPQHWFLERDFASLKKPRVSEDKD